MPAGLLLALAALASHPNSQSSSRLVVTQRRVELELLCQTRSVAEALPVDRDGDARLDAAELDAARPAILAYLRGHYELAAPPGVALELRAAELAVAPGSAGPLDEQRLLAHLELEASAPPAALTLHVTLFTEQNPFHRDTATVVWNDDEPLTFVFGSDAETWEFEPAAVRRPGVLASYVRMGVEHILTGFDHVAFLVALIVAARRLRSLVAVVTAFTLAHSVALASAALGALAVPARLVELAIALSIAYVAAENLLFRKPAARALEAFGFGLIHGLGFAGFLADSLVWEPLKITALVGFNLGVELGQLALVLPLALLLRLAPGDRAFEGDPRGWFAPRALRLGASALVTALGLWWFAQRAGWLP